MDFLNDKQQPGIEIYGAKEAESNIKFLRLRELYQIHTDVVQECIKKAMMFEPGYLNYLAKEEFKKELIKTNEIITGITGEKVLYVRPPYGT